MASVVVPVLLDQVPPLQVEVPVKLTEPEPPKVPAVIAKLASDIVPLAVKLPPDTVREPKRVEPVLSAPETVSPPPLAMVSCDPATVWSPLTVIPEPDKVTLAVPTLM